MVYVVHPTREDVDVYVPAFLIVQAVPERGPMCCPVSLLSPPDRAGGAQSQDVVFDQQRWVFDQDHKWFLISSLGS